MLLIPFLAEAQVDLSLTELADGFTNPCEIVNAGDERLFVVEQPGRIKILYSDGEVESTSFLDIQNRVTAGGERGLLGLAFPADYCTSGLFYVNYTTTIGNQLHTRISRFSVTGDDENVADADSEEVLMEYEQDFSNHNGGHIEFGPDGYLYIGNGDGGSGGDPNNRAQNLMSPLGKMLRIDVSTEPYTIPADNPFVGNASAMDEIWAYGLRNPWKFAFDSETGDMYIADVGQNAIEEVDFQSAASQGGENYGWRCYEGTDEYDMSQCGGVTDVTFPFFEFGHASQGSGGRCSVTGGRVYRGNSFPNLFGRYLFVDYCSNEYWTAAQDAGSWDVEIGDNDLGSSALVSFGSDIWGEMYAVSGGGSVHRVLEASGEWLDHIVVNGDNLLESTLEGSSYQWTYNGEIIDESDSRTISFLGSGVYSVVITTASGCEVQSGEVDITSVSVESHPFVERFEVYPNPSSGLVSLDIQLNTIPTNTLFVEVFSLEGKSVNSQVLELSSGNMTLDLTSLVQGVYFIQLTDNNGTTFAVEKMVMN